VGVAGIVFAIVVDVILITRTSGIVGEKGLIVVERREFKCIYNSHQFPEEHERKRRGLISNVDNTV
jgi:hypothetical protein